MNIDTLLLWALTIYFISEDDKFMLIRFQKKKLIRYQSIIYISMVTYQIILSTITSGLHSWWSSEKYDESEDDDVGINYIFNILSILFRHSREISITFWWIININFNFRSMIWSICILWNRSKNDPFHWIISFISSISPNDIERNYDSNKLVRVHYLNLSANEAVNTSSMTNDEKIINHRCWKFWS